jgi:hypothetical protein
LDVIFRFDPANQNRQPLPVPLYHRSRFAFPCDEAEAFVRDFPERYERQGYYRTASAKRIRPDEVELELVRIEEG